MINPFIKNEEDFDLLEEDLQDEIDELFEELEEIYYDELVDDEEFEEEERVLH